MEAKEVFGLRAKEAEWALAATTNNDLGWADGVGVLFCTVRTLGQMHLPGLSPDCSCKFLDPSTASTHHPPNLSSINTQHSSNSNTNTKHQYNTHTTIKSGLLHHSRFAERSIKGLLVPLTSRFGSRDNHLFCFTQNSQLSRYATNLIALALALRSSIIIVFSDKTSSQTSAISRPDK